MSLLRHTIQSSARVVDWAGVILVLGTALLYFATLDNGLQPEELVGGDLITHQYAQVQARPSNAPGYPLYTMGGWLWFHSLRAIARLAGDPLPNPIPLLSSYSTLWALLALWLLYRILGLVTRSAAWPSGNWALAWLLSAFYAVTYFFWYYATTTEQYSSAVAQTLAIVYVYLLWQDLPMAGQRIEQSSLRMRRLFLLAFLCGLSLAHMVTVAFIVPPLVAVIVWQAPGLLRVWRVWCAVLLAAALPLLSYSYVYLRGAAHPEWWGAGNWHNASAWFWAFISTAQGREELGWGFETGRAFFGNQFPELIWQELSLPLLIAGLVGIARLERRQAALLYGTLAIYLLFCWAYRYGNWFQVILPAYPLVLIGVAAALRSTADGGRGLPVVLPMPSATLKRLSYGLLVIAIAWRLTASWPATNSRNRPTDTALAHAAQLLAQPLPPQASLFAELNDGLALQYLIEVWQIRPDLRVVSSPLAAAALAQGRPVFATWQAAPVLRTELPADLNPALQSAGPDWIVFASGKPVSYATPDVVVEQAVTPDISLYGYSARPTPAAVPAHTAPPASTDVTLFWRIRGGEWPEGLSISVRPLLNGAPIANPAGATGGIIQQDNPRPAHGLLAPAGLPAEVPLADAYRLPLPITGADGLQVLLYRTAANGFMNVAELNLPLP